MTGVSGEEDGASLSQLLLSKGHEVRGLMRRSASADAIGTRLIWRGIDGQVALRHGNLANIASIVRIIQEVGRNEVPNLAHIPL